MSYVLTPILIIEAKSDFVDFNRPYKLCNRRFCEVEQSIVEVYKNSTKQDATRVSCSEKFIRMGMTRIRQSDVGAIFIIIAAVIVQYHLNPAAEKKP